MMTVQRLGQSYFSHPFDEIEEIRARALEHGLNRKRFDTFVGTGLSGALMAPVLAREFNKHFAVVRKAKDGSHSTAMVEGYLGERWVFVDDFISTGATLKRTRHAVAAAAQSADHETTFAGAYLYQGMDIGWKTPRQLQT